MRFALPTGALATALVLAAPWVAAQDAVTGEAIEVHATFHNVGVMVTISGDDDGDASAALEVDVGAGFVAGHRLSRVGADRFVGSAFFLDPNTPFEVRVTLDDPDGVSNGTLSASGNTRNLAVPWSDGATYHVAIGGDDDDDGSEDHPFATITRGVQAAGPGDMVLIREGVYHEQVEVLAGGTADNPLMIYAEGSATVVLDGADPTLKDATAWTALGGGVYSASVSQTRYVAVDGTRLWRYESLTDLQGLTEGTDGGFYFEGGTVYVRLPGDASPADHELQVSTLGRAFWIEGAPHVVISGLTIRCYGGEEYSEGIMVRDGSHDVWIVENTFENVMPGVWIKGAVDDLTVMGNEFSDLGLAEFPWYAVKAQGGMESGAIAVDDEYDGQGIVFYENYVHDSFDGLRICGGQAMGQPNNADVISNTIRHLGDDGIETDGLCSNVRIMLNRFEGSLVGVSVAPAIGGPTYAIRNLIADLKNVSPDTDWLTRAFKFNVGDTTPSGEIFVYHTTGVTYEADQAAFACTDDSVWERVELANNIWVGTDDAFYFVNTGDEPFVQDHDLFHTTGSGLIYYQGTHYSTVADYHDATGLCAACLADAPLFVDDAGGDYALQESSPALDQATAIPGVNDGYVGTGPDIGAYELGGAGPDADADGDSDTDADSDSDADVDLGPPTTPPADHDSCGCRAAGRALPQPSLLASLMVLI